MISSSTWKQCTLRNFSYDNSSRGTACLLQVDMEHSKQLSAVVSWHESVSVLLRIHTFRHCWADSFSVTQNHGNIWADAVVLGKCFPSLSWRNICSIVAYDIFLSLCVCNFKESWGMAVCRDEDWLYPECWGILVFINVWTQKIITLLLEY